MRVRIARGANQVGGSCIELECDGSRIVLDAGMPMGVVPLGRELLPDVPGLWGPGDGSLLGVVISHAHPDHIGLADLIDDGIPIYVGARAAAICRETRFFAPSALDLRSTQPLADGVPVHLGPFTVTPLAVDHGIDDAFALLVESGGKRVLYSADLRGHGHDTQCLDRLAQRAAAVDVLLLEGTRIGRGLPGTDEPTEADVEEAFALRMADAPNAVIVLSSGQNLDRVASVVRAAERAGRTAVLDLYVATLWSATGRPWPTNARVRLARSQRYRVMTSGDFERTRAVRHVRIYDDELVRRARELVIVPRTSALEELEDLGVLLNADVLWSMWSGYLSQDAMAPVLRVFKRNGAMVYPTHASGHASPEDLRRFVEELRPARVVPVHTDCPQKMASVIDGAELRGDGEWWSV